MVFPCFRFCKIGSAAICYALLTFCFLQTTACGEVKITEDDYEGRPQLKIVTDRATYFFDRAGGGFSRMLDREGNDWIAFHKDPLREVPASSAAGFRGIPNLVFGNENPDRGAGHPGFDQCTSEIVNDHSIHTKSRSGRWAWTWEFTDEHATLTIDKVDDAFPYWFLYEGPVGGKWSPKSHYFGTDRGGPRRDLPDGQHQLFDYWQWVYFGDDARQRVLLATQLSKDELEDTLWYMGNSNLGLDSSDGMVVFGFGRGARTNPKLRGAGKQFRIGFVESIVSSDQQHREVRKVAESWLAPARP